MNVKDMQNILRIETFSLIPVFLGYTEISLSVRRCVRLFVCPPVFKTLVSVKVLAGLLTLFHRIRTFNDLEKEAF